MLAGILLASIYGRDNLWTAIIVCHLDSQQVTRLQYSGISIVYQIGALFSVSLTPIVCAALLHANDGKPWFIAAYVIAAGVIQRDLRKIHEASGVKPRSFDRVFGFNGMLLVQFARPA